MFHRLHFKQKFMENLYREVLLFALKCTQMHLSSGFTQIAMGAYSCPLTPLLDVGSEKGEKGLLEGRNTSHVLNTTCEILSVWMFLNSSLNMRIVKSFFLLLRFHHGDRRM